ncbi:hypothetical protein FA95DRAFT_1591718 [Auriscalpium vulgare]|uniref:Uncharacterized protein n=1 Tax=Auriscalpium vulgare TaxID=40419 RepID=A0ACB8SCB2_9AGAM|nr:hypothetical protein FA95DRAFT_1591718 [Auriscalpium vulgare]
MGIAIWLVPSPDESNQLKSLMSRHPKPKHPSSYLQFHPHITLASVPSETTSVPTLRASIPDQEPVLPVQFAAVIAGNHYYRSIYAAIFPTTELTALHTHIHAALGDVNSPNTPAFPHLSLYYIADEDAREREEYLQEMVRSGVVVSGAGGQGVELDCGVARADTDLNAITRLSGFSGSEIWIVDCDGPVEGWTPLEKIKLETPRKQTVPLDVFD